MTKKCKLNLGAIMEMSMDEMKVFSSLMNRMDWENLSEIDNVFMISYDTNLSTSRIQKAIKGLISKEMISNEYPVCELSMDVIRLVRSRK